MSSHDFWWATLLFFGMVGAVTVLNDALDWIEGE